MGEEYRCHREDRNTIHCILIGKSNRKKSCIFDNGTL